MALQYSRPSISEYIGAQGLPQPYAYGTPIGLNMQAADKIQTTFDAVDAAAAGFIKPTKVLDKHQDYINNIQSQYQTKVDDLASINDPFAAKRALTSLAKEYTNELTMGDVASAKKEYDRVMGLMAEANKLNAEGKVTNNDRYVDIQRQLAAHTFDPLRPNFNTGVTNVMERMDRNKWQQEWAGKFKADGDASGYKISGYANGAPVYVNNKGEHVSYSEVYNALQGSLAGNQQYQREKANDRLAAKEGYDVNGVGASIYQLTNEDVIAAAKTLIGSAPTLSEKATAEQKAQYEVALANYEQKVANLDALVGSDPNSPEMMAIKDQLFDVAYDRSVIDVVAQANAYSKIEQDIKFGPKPNADDGSSKKTNTPATPILSKTTSHDITSHKIQSSADAQQKINDYDATIANNQARLDSIDPNSPTANYERTLYTLNIEAATKEKNKLETYRKNVEEDVKKENPVSDATVEKLLNILPSGYSLGDYEAEIATLEASARYNVGYKPTANYTNTTEKLLANGLNRIDFDKYKEQISKQQQLIDERMKLYSQQTDTPVKMSLVPVEGDNGVNQMIQDNIAADINTTPAVWATMDAQGNLVPLRESGVDDGATFKNVAMSGVSLSTTLGKQSFDGVIEYSNDGGETYTALRGPFVRIEDSDLVAKAMDKNITTEANKYAKVKSKAEQLQIQNNISAYLQAKQASLGASIGDEVVNLSTRMELPIQSVKANAKVGTASSTLVKDGSKAYTFRFSNPEQYKKYVDAFNGSAPFSSHDSTNTITFKKADDFKKFINNVSK